MHTTPCTRNWKTPCCFVIRSKENRIRLRKCVRSVGVLSSVVSKSLKAAGGANLSSFLCTVVTFLFILILNNLFFKCLRMSPLQRVRRRHLPYTKINRSPQNLQLAVDAPTEEQTEVVGAIWRRNFRKVSSLSPWTKKSTNRNRWIQIPVLKTPFLT